MTGAELKEILGTLPLSIKEIGDKIGATGQAMGSTFRSPSVKSDILEDLARELGVGMAFFYPEINEQKEQRSAGKDFIEQNNTFGNNYEGSANNELVKALREQIETQNEMLKTLTKTIEALSNK